MQAAPLPVGTEVRLDQLLALRLVATDLGRLPLRPRAALAEGEQRSRQRGEGRDFAELRAYQPGEDVRRIDWRVTARRNEPYVRLFEAERRRPQLIWLDLSASLYFGSSLRFKSVLACHWAAFLAWRLVGQRQAVRLLITGPGSDQLLRLNRPADVAAACARLAEAHRQLAGHYLNDREAPAAGRLAAALAGRPAVWLISDLQPWTPASLDRALPVGQVAALTVLQPLDAVEAQLPAVGSLELQVGSTRQRLHTDSPRTRQRHQHAFAERQQGWHDWALRRDAGWRPLQTQTFDWSEVHHWPLTL